MGSTGHSEGRGIYSDFEKHSSADIRSTDVVISASIRRHHPDLTLTVTTTSICDLLGFADKGGFATANLVLGGGSFAAVRRYSPPARRSDDVEGVLEDKISFARYDYAWFEKDFIIYIVDCFSEPVCTGQNTFILHRPQGNETPHSQSSVTDELIVAASQWTLELHNEILVFDMGAWTKSRDLWKSVQDASWKDVILDEGTKQSLISDVEGFYDAKDTYEQYGVPWKRGIIFHGPPGNGKTCSMRALMNSLSKRIETVASLYVKTFASRGGPEYAIRSIFQKARASAPCFLILEDIDSLVTDKVRSYFLNEVDGLESNDGILILGSTNHLEKLDPGISKRPSRFDRKYAFRLPVLAERIQYCNYWREKLMSNQDIRFTSELCPFLADLTDEFTFAYMKEAFVATLLRLASRPAKMSVKSEVEDKLKDSNEAGITSSPFYKEFKKQVKILREQMSEKPVVRAVQAETKVIVPSVVQAS